MRAPPPCVYRTDLFRDFYPSHPSSPWRNSTLSLSAFCVETNAIACLDWLLVKAPGLIGLIKTET